MLVVVKNLSSPLAQRLEDACVNVVGYLLPPLEHARLHAVQLRWIAAEKLLNDSSCSTPILGKDPRRQRSLKSHEVAELAPKLLLAPDKDGDGATPRRLVVCV